jgi:hypothetical protein
MLVLNALAVTSIGQNWFRGSLVTAGDSVLVGEIQSYPSLGMVLIRHEGEVTVFPAHRMSACYYFDPEQNMNVRLISVKTETSHDRLFEVVVDGSMKVIRCQRVRSLKSSTDPAAYDYFVFSSGVLTQLDQFRTRCFEQLRAQYPQQISSFVSSHRLNPNRPADAIRIVEYYNSLSTDVWMITAVRK